MIKVCLNCNQKFDAAHRQQKFCSRKCYIQYRKKTHDGIIEYQNIRLPPTDADMKEIWGFLEQWQEQTHRLSTRQDEVAIKINADSPVFVAFLADLHIGAVGTHYAEFHQKIDKLASSPQTFIVSCGDTLDNYLPSWHAEGSFEAICPPEIQKRLIEYIYGKLKGKILAIIQGDHDESSHYADDFDWTKYLCEKLECANLGFGGFIDLTVGKQSYRILARHRYRFNSSFNLTHTVKRMREQLGDFDVGVVAHNHQSAIEYVAMSDKTRVFVRPGSFKAADRYARRIGFTDLPCQIPIVKLWPDERRMLVFPDLKYIEIK